MQHWGHPSIEQTRIQRGTLEYAVRRLSLADGRRWRFIGVGGAAPWVSRLAVHMRLDEAAAEGVEDGAVVFICSATLGDGIAVPLEALPAPLRGGLPHDGWTAREVRWGRIWRHAAGLHVLYELPAPALDNPAWERAKLWTAVEPVYRRAMAEGGLVIHGGLIDCGGVGAVIAAPGGMGKTTCSRRLPPHWEALSDDEALIVRNAPCRYCAHPFPTWSHCVEEPGTRSWDVQRHVLLGGVFFLEQGDVDRVTPLAPSAAALLLNRTSLADWGPLAWAWLPEQEAKAVRVAAFRSLCAIEQAVPCFVLRASLDGRFWEPMEDALARATARSA